MDRTWTFDLPGDESVDVVFVRRADGRLMVRPPTRVDERQARAGLEDLARELARLGRELEASPCVTCLTAGATVRAAGVTLQRILARPASTFPQPGTGGLDGRHEETEQQQERERE